MKLYVKKITSTLILALCASLMPTPMQAFSLSSFGKILSENRTAACLIGTLALTSFALGYKVYQGNATINKLKQNQVSSEAEVDVLYTMQKSNLEKHSQEISKLHEEAAKASLQILLAKKEVEEERGASARELHQQLHDASNKHRMLQEKLAADNNALTQQLSGELEENRSWAKTWAACYDRLGNQEKVFEEQIKKLQAQIKCHKATAIAQQKQNGQLKRALTGENNALEGIKENNERTIGTLEQRSNATAAQLAATENKLAELNAIIKRANLRNRVQIALDVLDKANFTAKNQVASHVHQLINQHLKTIDTLLQEINQNVTIIRAQSSQSDQRDLKHSAAANSVTRCLPSCTPIIATPFAPQDESSKQLMALFNLQDLSLKELAAKLETQKQILLGKLDTLQAKQTKQAQDKTAQTEKQRLESDKTKKDRDVQAKEFAAHQAQRAANRQRKHQEHLKEQTDKETALAEEQRIESELAEKARIEREKAATASAHATAQAQAIKKETEATAVAATPTSNAAAQAASPNKELEEQRKKKLFDAEHAKQHEKNLRDYQAKEDALAVIENLQKNKQACRTTPIKAASLSWWKRLYSGLNFSW